MLLGKTVTVKLMALVGAVLALAGCGGPHLFAPGETVGVKLTLHLSSPLSQDVSESSRLLLPSTNRIEVTLKRQGGESERKTQNLATGSTSVTFQLDLEALVPYTLSARAFDASGTLIAAGDTDVVLSQNTSAALSLLPVKPDGSTLWTTLAAKDQVAGSGVGANENLPAGKSMTFVVDLGETASGFTVANLPSEGKAYAQRVNGANLGGGTQVSRSALGGDSRFLLTIYNGGANPLNLLLVGRFTIPLKTLTAPNLTLDVDEVKTISPTLAPSNADPRVGSDFGWTTANPAVATISAPGTVTGVAAGTSLVTIVDQATSVTTTFTITVRPLRVTGVSLNKTSQTLTPNDSTTLVATVLPAKATNASVQWSSSNTSVATVDSGVVTAKGLGTSEIQVKTVDGDFVATCTITVVPLVIPVDSVVLGETTKSLVLGSSYSPVATVLPASATNKTVTWATSDATVATVDAASGLVTAVGLGTTTVTVTTSNAAKTASVVITVTPVLVSGVSLNITNQSLSVGETFTPVATISPANATNQTVTWSSSDPAVASVNASTGLVTAQAPGSATITVTTTDGARTASLTVTVLTGVSTNFSPTAYGALGFQTNNVSLDHGEALVLVTSSSELQANGTDWQVWIDGVLIPSSWVEEDFVVDTSLLAPGQYYLDLLVTWQSISYSGSLTINVLSKGIP